MIFFLQALQYPQFFGGGNMQLVQPDVFFVSFCSLIFLLSLKSGVWIWCYITNKSIGGNCILEVKILKVTLFVYILKEKCSCVFTNTIKRNIFILCTYRSSLFVTAMHCKTQPFLKRGRGNFLIQNVELS